MKKNWKRVSVIVMSLLMVVMLLPLGSFKAQAEEGEDEPEVLGTDYKVGDIIKFGKYEQDGNDENGKEDIEWQVLKVESDRVLVVSKYILDGKPYNDEWIDITWEDCSLRKWMNGDFMNAAFTKEQQKKILSVTLKNNNNPKSGVSGGNDTVDKVFCLSWDDINTYFGKFNKYFDVYMFGYNQSLLCAPTQYAKDKGILYEYIHQEDFNNDSGFYNPETPGWNSLGPRTLGYTTDAIGGHSPWILRTVGFESNRVIGIGTFGGVGAGEDSSWGTSYTNGIRPAMYLKTTIDPTEIKLDKSSVTMCFGESITITPTILPTDATDKTITWTSSKPTVATVNNGVVKAKSAGKTIITAKTVNELTATCEITVFADNVSGNIFADIKADSWMYTPAKSVYDKGYMTGTGNLDGRVLFSPNTDMNRTMFVQALYSMDGKPDVTYVQKFSDVKESAWYAKAVTWASNNGVVAGNADGTFGINGKATREQLALMFYKYAVSKKLDVTVKPSTTLDGFNDANKVDSWALTAVKWAVERGIISGKGNASTGYRIDPIGKATRVECAAMMNKFSEIYTNAPKMSDEDLEEPLALPEEEIEDLPVPVDETEDVIIDDEEDAEDKDIPSEDETDMDEGEVDTEEEVSTDTEE